LDKTAGKRIVARMVVPKLFGVARQCASGWAPVLDGLVDKFARPATYALAR
jgi:hypothetical protein